MPIMIKFDYGEDKSHLNHELTVYLSLSNPEPNRDCNDQMKRGRPEMINFATGKSKTKMLSDQSFFTQEYQYFCIEATTMMTVSLKCAFPPVIAESYTKKKNKAKVEHLEKLNNMKFFDESYSQSFTSEIKHVRDEDHEKTNYNTYIENYRTGMRYFRYEE